LFKSVLSEVRKGPYPKVHFLHGDMSDAEVSRLYRVESIKALVSLTRGEGFGLPLLEAAASGLPVIATNWSAHTEFLKHIKFVPIDYSLAQVHPSRVDGKIFMPGSKWAEPSEADFKKKIIKFRNSPSIPASWAKEGSSIIKEKYNFKEISRLYDQALEKFFT
jgi:glycosyltransferase involved in cell wall biosynthesis